MKNKTKPFIFTFLSALCFIEPVMKILYFKAITHFDFLVILTNLQARNSFFEVFDFWLAFPIAGFLILKLRRWTYFGFMSILSYVLYKIATYEEYTWPYNSDSPFMYNYVVAGLALGVFVYFLFPKAREPFFDRRMRWWEIKERYNVQFSCQVHTKNLSFASQILNISESGAFLKENSYLRVGDELDIDFTFMGETLRLPLVVVHRSESEGRRGFGVSFRFSTIGQRLRMAKVVRVIRNSHAVFNNSKDLKIVA